MVFDDSFSGFCWDDDDFLDVGKNILFLLSRRAWSSLEMGLMDIIDDI